MGSDLSWGAGPAGGQLPGWVWDCTGLALLFSSQLQGLTMEDPSGIPDLWGVPGAHHGTGSWFSQMLPIGNSGPVPVVVAERQDGSILGT